MINLTSSPAPKAFLQGRARFERGGFTLLEICIVLVILGLLMTVMAPGIQSAFSEAAVRSDARQLSLMVKTAMLQSAEEHRAYVLNLSEKEISLGPIAPAPPDQDASSDQPYGQLADSTQTCPLDSGNQLLLPDPKAPGHWQKILAAQWIFRPGELCPAAQVCFTRGEARLEMTFNALTGNVEDERSVFP